MNVQHKKANTDWSRDIAEEKMNLNRVMKFISYSDDMQSHLNSLELRQLASKALNRLRYFEMVQSVYYRATKHLDWNGNEVDEELTGNYNE